MTPSNKNQADIEAEIRKSLGYTGPELKYIDQRTIESISTLLNKLVGEARISFYRDWLEWLSAGNENSLESVERTMKTRLRELTNPGDK